MKAEYHRIPVAFGCSMSELVVRDWYGKPLKTPLPWDDEVTTDEESPP